jgi:FixJ family two-component response regulator
VPGLPIFVIDDDESTRTSLAGLLRLLGFEAITYPSAEEFLAIGCHTPCCCVISDVHMPGLSGIDLKRQLDQSGRPPPVILITGRSEPRLLAEAEASGAVCVLRKPFDAETLLASLRQARIAPDPSR